MQEVFEKIIDKLGKEFGVKSGIVNQPWYLDRVDDCYDSTYCDIYAKIKC